MDNPVFLTILTLNRFLFWIVFLITVLQFLRARDLVRFEILLMSGSVAVIITAMTLPTNQALDSWELIGAAALAGQPYFFFRLARHVRRIPKWVERAALTISIAAGLVIFATLEDRPVFVTAAVLAALVGLEFYVAWLFLRWSVATQGVTRWRSTLVSIASASFGVIVLMVGFALSVPEFIPAIEIPALLLITGCPLA
jgi:hypothetical protein